VCAIGGAKVKDKVGVFTNLLDRVERFVIGGGMANTFLAAQGIDVGNEPARRRPRPARPRSRGAARARRPLHLPIDAVVSTAFDADDRRARPSRSRQIGDRMILDIGPRTARAYASAARSRRTIVFNGPMGVYEKAPYRDGTRTSARRSPRRRAAARPASSAAAMPRRPRTNWASPRDDARLDRRRRDARISRGKDAARRRGA
jgi:3-phosphoglycerate kinase